MCVCVCVCTRARVCVCGGLSGREAVILSSNKLEGRCQYFGWDAGVEQGKLDLIRFAQDARARSCFDVFEEEFLVGVWMDKSIHFPYFKPLLHFYTPWKPRKKQTHGFLKCSGGIKLCHWAPFVIILFKDIVFHC